MIAVVPLTVVNVHNMSYHRMQHRLKMPFAIPKITVLNLNILQKISTEARFKYVQPESAILALFSLMYRGIYDLWN